MIRLVEATIYHDLFERLNMIYSDLTNSVVYICDLKMCVWLCLYGYLYLSCL